MSPNHRIDSDPTHRFGDYKLRMGRPLPFGATFVPDGINFSIFSRHATSCALVLYEKDQPEPLVEIPFPSEFRVGDVFAMVVFDLNPEQIEYGYRIDGPWQPYAGHRFDPRHVLLDPYAKRIGGREAWGVMQNGDSDYVHRGQFINDDYDWGHDRPLNIPIEDLVIYEMHVRGFTRHFSSGVRYPGTYAAIREKIPYLKELGVNCVELMPIFEFDEFEYDRVNPNTGEQLMNYWGYSTVGFFAPKAGYAATGTLGMQVDEVKTMIKDLHSNGIEVMLDVVFNHTAEGNEHGETISFRGIDNKTYYLLTPNGHYYNFSGTGNTMNANHPVVRNMVLDCLRYWVSEYHIDGFRFDLASILGRAQTGEPLANPPLLEMLAHDPVLANCKLIAEAWDAGGLYQVGSFPAYERWAEWNGQYRDTIRRFIKGDMGIIWEAAERIQGSPDLYSDRGAAASINFITAHDGFTLADLWAYNEKHNDANGENNRDGANDNYSWNCGHEGQTDTIEINILRKRMIKNSLAILMMSRGTPMILMGDEMARSKQGNNNTYCHDNDLTWLNWGNLEENYDVFNFFKRCIAFRHAHPILRSPYHFSHEDQVGSGYTDISWHGTRARDPAWGDHARMLAFMLDGQHADDDSVYVAMNMYWEPHQFELPHLYNNWRWHMFADTSALDQPEIYKPGSEPVLSDQDSILVNARTVIILVGRSPS